MLSWNGKSVVQVVIPQKYGDAVTGICGNCNGRQDDYRTRKGLDVSNKRNKYGFHHRHNISEILMKVTLNITILAIHQIHLHTSSINDLEKNISFTS
jgi:hypothetical protein